MKLSSVFLSLLFSYFAAAQSISLPPVQTTTTTDASTSSTPTSRTTSTSTSTTSVSSTSSDTSRASSASSSSPPPRPTSTDLLPLSPSLTTLRSSDVVVIQTSSVAPTTSSSSVPPPPSSDSGLGTGSIIGLSVAGGVAVIGVVAFFIWKFTRKRFTDFDDNEAITWPDHLHHNNSGNVDSHPLPVKSTGRSGFDTGSDGDLSLSNNYSTPDFNQNIAPDPYAVPPLPHLNPNQPYTDDPVSMAGYYDPYRGPVPGTLENGVPTPAPEWGSEAIPMTQMGVAAGAGPGGRNSPGPQMGYDLGRRSPGPYAAYDGAVSGRLSPGPQLAYNAGTISPAPGGRT